MRQKKTKHMWFKRKQKTTTQNFMLASLQSAPLLIVTDFAYCCFREVLWFGISAEISYD